MKFRIRAQRFLGGWGVQAYPGTGTRRGHSPFWGGGPFSCVLHVFPNCIRPELKRFAFFRPSLQQPEFINLYKSQNVSKSSY
eukprot:2820653-Rhodomonas_salina.1